MIGKFLRSERAAVAVEYAVLLAVIVLVIIAAVTEVGQQTRAKYEHISDEVSNAGK